MSRSPAPASPNIKRRSQQFAEPSADPDPQLAAAGLPRSPYERLAESLADALRSDTAAPPPALPGWSQLADALLQLPRLEDSPSSRWAAVFADPTCVAEMLDAFGDASRAAECERLLAAIRADVPQLPAAFQQQSASPMPLPAAAAEPPAVAAAPASPLRQAQGQAEGSLVPMKGAREVRELLGKAAGDTRCTLLPRFEEFFSRGNAEKKVLSLRAFVRYANWNNYHRLLSEERWRDVAAYAADQPSLLEDVVLLLGELSRFAEAVGDQRIPQLVATAHAAVLRDVVVEFSTCAYRGSSPVAPSLALRLCEASLMLLRCTAVREDTRRALAIALHDCSLVRMCSRLHADGRHTEETRRVYQLLAPAPHAANSAPSSSASSLLADLTAELLKDWESAVASY
eukprot:m51a1_g3777 hypothetical protein (400) ;mRNA; f:151731-152930